MKSKAVSRVMLMLLSISMLTLAFDIQLLEASETIFIRADGSVDPATAPIQRDGNVYTLTDNIYDSIVVERDNIVVDGAGCSLQGIGTYGIELLQRSNVTIKNLKFQAFTCGIYLGCSVNNSIFGNTIVDNVYGIGLVLDCLSNSIYDNNITNNEEYGIMLTGSSNNTILGNYITNNGRIGIHLHGSSNNTISKNYIANHRFDGIDLEYFSNRNCVYKNSMVNNNYFGIGVYSNENNISVNDIRANNKSGVILDDCSNNIIYGNNITGNGYGWYLGIPREGYGIQLFGSSDNTIYHNNFVNNRQQVDSYRFDSILSVNAWDDGYPSGGNYWSDYNGTDADGDGIGNTPYVIDEDNQDNNPLMEQWTPSWSARVPVWTQWWFWRIVIAAIAASAVAIYFWKKRKKPTPTVPPLPS